jgi:hypothetical protein
VSIHTPGGFERFVEEAGVPCSAENDAPVVDAARVTSILDKHGMDVPSKR